MGLRNDKIEVQEGTAPPLEPDQLGQCHERRARVERDAEAILLVVDLDHGRAKLLEQLLATLLLALIQSGQITCQHCDDAPCEPVCPVFATYQNAEGLNVQVHSRCIGTRYCANNCPYTVRFFNWFEPVWPDSLQLQLNPDVSIRPGGVMEKCTFCIQRIQRGKRDAKAEGRELADGDVQPACVQSCPAEAMAFGDLSDPESKVSRWAGSGRSSQLLGELGTKPRVFYLERAE